MPTVRLRRPVRGVVPGPRALPRCHLRLQREEGGFLGAMTINYVVTAVVFLAGRRPLIQSFAWPFQLVRQIGRIQAGQRLQQVREALEVYRLLKGSYPESLEALEREGILSPGFFASDGALPYVYQLKAEGAEGPPYSLEALSPGS